MCKIHRFSLTYALENNCVFALRFSPRTESIRQECHYNVVKRNLRSVILEISSSRRLARSLSSLINIKISVHIHLFQFSPLDGLKWQQVFLMQIYYPRFYCHVSEVFLMEYLFFNRFVKLLNTILRFHWVSHSYSILSLFLLTRFIRFLFQSFARFY